MDGESQIGENLLEGFDEASAVPNEVDALAASLESSGANGNEVPRELINRDMNNESQSTENSSSKSGDDDSDIST
ncbi:MAG: hypothetical protein GY874_22265, partial [Desulfobacteraceae bacterium]|nr:hypothetical protein [Desulfobacteraceae bacterium]